MASKTHRSTHTARKLRKAIGIYLQRLRQQAGFTQLQVAEQMGYQYFTFVAQIEHGRSRVPPDDWTSWAVLYKQDPQTFSRRLLMHYDPHVYKACFSQGASGNDDESS